MPAFVHSCDGSGTHPSCGSKTPHKHCVCGLAMALTAEQCDMCLLEGCVPLDVDMAEWDGRTYPSWRDRRSLGHWEGYLLLGKAIGEGMTPRDYASIKGRRLPQ